MGHEFKSLLSYKNNYFIFKHDWLKIIMSTFYLFFVGPIYLLFQRFFLVLKILDRHYIESLIKDLFMLKVSFLELQKKHLLHKCNPG